MKLYRNTAEADYSASVFFNCFTILGVILGVNQGVKNRKSTKIAVFVLKLLSFISFLVLNDGL